MSNPKKGHRLVTFFGLEIEFYKICKPTSKSKNITKPGAFLFGSKQSEHL